MCRHSVGSQQAAIAAKAGEGHLSVSNGPPEAVENQEAIDDQVGSGRERLDECDGFCEGHGVVEGRVAVNGRISCY